MLRSAGSDQALNGWRFFLEGANAPARMNSIQVGADRRLMHSTQALDCCLRVKRPRGCAIAFPSGAEPPCPGCFEPLPALGAAVVGLAFPIQDGLESRAQAGPGLGGENQGQIGLVESFADGKLARANIRTW